MNMRREFRRLYDADPVAFLEVLELLQRQGIKALPSAHKRKGRPAEIHRGTLAMLLADWENAKASGMRKAEFLEKNARQGVKWSSEKGKVWRNEETLADHIKTAQQLARTDEAFAEDVSFYRWALNAIGGAR